MKERKKAKMKFKATIEITPLELKHIIADYLESHGIKMVSDQDIHFIVEGMSHGNQLDSWTTYELTKVRIDGVGVGEEKK